MLGEDFNTLDRLFTSYLSPLLVSQVNSVCSPKQRAISIEDRANKIISTILSSNTTATNQYPANFPGHAFKCLYKASSSPAKSQSICKKHLSYIVKLFEGKQHDQIKIELDVLYHQLLKLFPRQLQAPEQIQPNSQSLDLWLVRGIKPPFAFTGTETSRQCIPIIITFNFFYFQHYVQSFSTNIKSVDLQIVEKVVELLRSDSFFSQWIALSNNITKHYKSMLKFTKGLEKIVKFLSRQNNLAGLQLALKLKQEELKISLGEDGVDEIEFTATDIDMMQSSKWIQEFARDLFNKLPEDDKRHALLMPVFASNRCEVTDGIDSFEIDRNIPKVEEFIPFEMKRILLQSPTEKKIQQIIYAECNSDKTIESILLEHPTSLSFVVCQLVLVAMEANIILEKHINLNILDLITIQMKRTVTSLSENESHTPQLTINIMAILVQLFTVYAKGNHTRRIRNISNLLFNLGNRSQNIDADLAIKCWAICLDYEEHINDGTNLSSYREKVEKAINTMYELEAYQEASELLLRFMAKIPNQPVLNPFNMPLIFQLLVKCMVADTTLVKKIWNDKLLEENMKVIFYVKVIQLLEKSSNVEEKTELINFITSNLDINSHVNLLIAQYHYNNINGLSKTLPSKQIFIDSSTENSTICLFACANAFQRLVNEGNNNDLTTTIFYAKEWEKYQNIDAFEMKTGIKILTHIFQYISNMGLEYLNEIMQDFDFPLNPTEGIRFESIRSKTLLENGGSMKACMDSLLKSSSLFKKLGPSDINLQDLTNWKLLQFEFQLKYDHDRIYSTSAELTKFFVNNINLEEKSLNLETKFTNLWLVAKFRYLNGQKFITTNFFVEAHENFRMCIKILHSLIKRVGSNFSKSTYLELKWSLTSLLMNSFNLIIITLIKLGNSNDISHYVTEYQKVVDTSAQTEQIKSLNRLRLSNINILMKERDAAIRDSSLATQPDMRGSKYNELLLLGLHGERLDTVAISKVHKLLQTIDINWGETLVSVSYIHSLLNVSNYELVTEEYGKSYDMYHLILLWLVNLKKLIFLGVALSTNEVMAGFQYLLTLYRSNKVGSLATYELKDLMRTLLVCYLNFGMFTKDADSKLLSEIFIALDFSKYSPFENYKKMSKVKSVELIPGIEIEPENNYAERVLSFEKLTCIPSNWNIISIDYCQHSEEIQIFKYNSHNNKPVYINLSLNRWKKYGFEGGLSFESFFHEFKQIISLSDLSTKKATTSKVKSKDQRQNWWRNRFNLDLRLKALMESVEKFWIGGFKELFNLPTKADSASFFCSIQKQLPKEELINVNLTEELISVLISCIDDEQYFCDVIHQIVPRITQSSIVKVKAILKDDFQVHEETENSDDNHIVLITSTNCANIPWESLPFLRGKSVSRMPSLGSFIDTFTANSNISVSNLEGRAKLFYLINPEGDLQRTESNFGEIFNDMYGEGLVGEKPQSGELFQKVLNADLFIYLGHGGCEQYIKTSDILGPQTIQNPKKLPPSLLIGCSSGSLSDNGLLEPHGNVYNWLVGGSPMVMVNLWDVTDKDIDKFSVSVFKEWGLFDMSTNHLNICQAVSISRDMCTLAYLNGSAPVVYGLPLYLRK